jgi:cytochrome c peroxidase
LKEQAVGPIQNPIEMGITGTHAVEMLRGIPGYQPMFAAAFPDEKEKISIANVGKAIAAFEATLVTPNAPFDKYLRGDDGALSADQKAGLKLFMEKGCAGCHNGINIGGASYAPFGVVEKPGADILPPADKGRFQVTKTASDEYVFKVPTLRNIELTPPYFHSGRAWDLKQAVGVRWQRVNGTAPERCGDRQCCRFLRALTASNHRSFIPSSRRAPALRRSLNGDGVSAARSKMDVPSSPVAKPRRSRTAGSDSCWFACRYPRAGG